MHQDAQQLVGPDFIGKLADCQLDAGLEVDAAALRNNQRAWAEDRATIERQDRELRRMQDRLEAIDKAVKGSH